MVHLCQLEDAHVWEVLRPGAEVSPCRRTNWRQAEFLLQVGVLFGVCVVDAVEQPSLPDEEGFHLKEVVAVVVHGAQRQGSCPFVEGIAVDAEAEVAGEGGEVCVVPRTVHLPDALLYGYCLTFEPLGLQCAHPGVHLQWRQ